MSVPFSRILKYGKLCLISFTEYRILPEQAAGEHV